jgi:hypothetical protein
MTRYILKLPHKTINMTTLTCRTSRTAVVREYFIKATTFYRSVVNGNSVNYINVSGSIIYNN